MVRFAAIFLIFTLVALAFSAFATYENQNELYRQQCESSIKYIADYLSKLLVTDGNDFPLYQRFCLEYGHEMRIPIDFTNPDVARSNFERMFEERYPDKILGETIAFDELDHDIQLAYAEYKHEYYLLEFEKAKEAFNIEYTYYVVPRPQLGEDYMMFLLDGVREPSEDDESLLNVCFEYPQPAESHRLMWEAWNTGESPEGYDAYDNEYGKTYGYYMPLYINGEKLGVIAAEISIAAVNDAILRNALMQFVMIGAILILSMLLMLIFINRAYIKRIGDLESEVREYAANKDPAVAEKIEANAAGKHEIASLARQTAEMVRELDQHINDIRTITAEKERFTAELGVATKIQADMLPTDFPKRSDIELYAAMTPAKEVGGDFYDFFFIDDDHLALVMADVSGKGVPAALFCVVAKAVLRDKVMLGGSPAQVLYEVNNILCQNNGGGLFITVWLGILDLKTGIVEYANAGHEYPIIGVQNGMVKVIKKDHCPPLAAEENTKFENENITLKKGDRLFLYTDGVPEAKSSDGKRFGMDRLMEVLERNAKSSCERIVKDLKREVEVFQPENDPFDDVTIMSLIWKGD